MRSFKFKHLLSLVFGIHLVLLGRHSGAVDSASKSQVARIEKQQREDFCLKQLSKWSKPFTESAETVQVSEKYLKKIPEVVGTRKAKDLIIQYRIFDCDNPVIELDLNLRGLSARSDSEIAKAAVQSLQSLSVNENASQVLKHILEALIEFDNFSKAALADGYLILPTKANLSCQFKRLSKSKVRLRYSQLN